MFVQSSPEEQTSGRHREGSRESAAHRHRIDEALLEVSRLLSAPEGCCFEALLKTVGKAARSRGVYLQIITPDDPQLKGVPGTGARVVVWRSSAPAGALCIEGDTDAEPDEPGDSTLDIAVAEFESWLQRDDLEVLAVPVLSSRGNLYGYFGLVYEASNRSNMRNDRVLNVVGDMLGAYFDRQAVERWWQQSEERWRRLVESHPDAILILRDGQFVYSNPSGARLFGAPSAEALVGRPLIDFVSAEEHDCILRAHLEDHSGEARSHEFEVSRLDGEWRTVESVSAPIVYENIPAVQIVLRDITERKRSEQGYQTFVRTISEGILRIDLEQAMPLTWVPERQVDHLLSKGFLAECNQVMAEHFQAGSPQELIGSPIGVLLRDRSMVEAFVSQGYNLQSYELVVPGRQSRQKHFVLNAVGTIERGKLISVWGSCIDVTERVELERHTVSALERQQQLIGRELHDGVGQLLTSIRMLSTVLYDSLPADLAARSLAQKVLRYAEEASLQMRDIYSGLTPVQLTTERLSAVLEDLAQKTNELPNVECTFIHDGETDVTDEETKLHLYRIIQEATNNALKHAKAKKIEISFMREGEDVVLQVKDDGIGIQPGRANPKSLGISSMHYRARTIRCKLEIGNGSDGGTLLRCTLPRPD